MSLIEKIFRIFRKENKTQKIEIELSDRPSKSTITGDIARAKTGYSSTLGVKTLVCPTADNDVDIWKIQTPPQRRSGCSWILNTEDELRWIGGREKDIRPKWETASQKRVI